MISFARTTILLPIFTSSNAVREKSLRCKRLIEFFAVLAAKFDAFFRAAIVFTNRKLLRNVDQDGA